MSEDGDNFFNQLPLELVSKIFSHLGFNDVQKNLFVCKYFYNAITSTPNYNGLAIGHALAEVTSSTTGKSVSLIPMSVTGENVAELTPQMKYYLNLLTRKGELTIHRLQLDLKSIRNNSDMLSFLIKNYRINALDVNHIGDNKTLFTIGEGTKFQFLRDLRLHLFCPLSMNDMQTLARSAPYLETLEIFDCNGIEGTYTGDGFLNLAYFGIHNNALTRQLAPLSAIFSLLSKAPNLSHLRIKGGISSDSSTEPMKLFLEFMPKLQFLDFFPNIYDFTEIRPANTKLTELHFRTNARGFQRAQEYPLVQIETFGFTGNFCNLALEYYGIGDNLKILWVHSDQGSDYGSVYSPLVWERCPCLEQLIAVMNKPSVKWLVELVNIYCKRLRLVSFDGFNKEDSGYNIELLSTPIKDIYISTKLPDNEVNWLVNNGLIFITEVATNIKE